MWEEHPVKRKVALLFAGLICVAGVLWGCDALDAFDWKTDTEEVNKEVDLTVSETAIGWPADRMGNLPKLTAKVANIIGEDEAKCCSVIFEQCSQTDAQAYLEALKKLGYQNGMEFSDNEGILLTGTDGGGNSVFFSYNTADGGGTVIYTPLGAAETAD